MIKQELIKRKCQILIDNYETDSNPHYYFDGNVYKRLHALCIITDEYMVTEKAINRFGREYERKEKRTRISSMICEDDNEIGFILSASNPTEVDKIYFESIINHIKEQNDSRHPENSTISIEGVEVVRKDDYHPSQKANFKVSLPLHSLIDFYKIYNVGNGMKRLINANWSMTTSQLFKMFVEKYNEVQTLSSTLTSNLKKPKPGLVVRDTRDVIAERHYERANRRESWKAETYKPIKALKELPGFIKDSATNAIYGTYDFVVNKLRIRNLVVYASIIVALACGVKLIKDEHRNTQLRFAQNGSDMFTFDTQHATNKDKDLQIERGTYAPRVTELVDNNKTSLLKTEIEQTREYMGNVVSSKFDHNASNNEIDLSKMIPDTITSQKDKQLYNKKMDLVNKIKSKTEKCIYRPNANNVIEINKEKAKEFLDFNLPLFIFGEDCVEHPYSYKSFGSSNSNNPTTEQIETFATFPDITKSTLLAQVREVYKLVPEYEFIHPSATPAGDSKKYDVMKKLNEIEGAINLRLLAQASDYVVQAGYRASGGK